MAYIGIKEGRVQGDHEKRRETARAKFSLAPIALLPLAKEPASAQEEEGTEMGLTPSYARAFASKDAPAAAA